MEYRSTVGHVARRLGKKTVTDRIHKCAPTGSGDGRRTWCKATRRGSRVVLLAVGLLAPRGARAQAPPPSSPSDAAASEASTNSPSDAAAPEAHAPSPSDAGVARTSVSNTAASPPTTYRPREEQRGGREAARERTKEAGDGAGIAPVSAAKEPDLPAHPLGWEAFRPWVVPAEGIATLGYLQLQYESHQDSLNQLFQGGAPQNKDRFDVRRARLISTGEWQYVAYVLELDANTVSGPQVDLRKAEGSLQYRPDRKKPALVMATLGMFDTPFGYEVVEVPRTRWFMEPSTAARALWPGSADVGVRLAGAASFFRWTVAVLNGHPLGETSPYALQDPIGWKDVVARFGVDVTPRENFHIAGGISSTRGKGFHAGTDATPASIQWIDANRDGQLQPNELKGIPAQSARPSQTFDRFALGADLRLHFRSRLGVTKIYGEVVVASNMDRGLFVADPALTHVDQRELGYYVGLVQEIGRYGVVGFRYDLYDPNLDAFDKRGGALLPYGQAITTYAPLIGVTLPERFRLTFEYDFIANALGRDSRGVPASLAMNTWTLRLQVQQ
jgi:hypothetical protein